MKRVKLHFTRFQITDRTFKCLNFAFFKDHTTKKLENVTSEASVATEESKSSALV